MSSSDLSDGPFAGVGATFNLGTTPLALNRSSSPIALTGITSIDGSAASLTTPRGIDGVLFNGTGNIWTGPRVVSDGVQIKFLHDGTSTIYRLDWQSSVPYALYSTARTNYLFHSEAINNAYFFKSALTITSGVADPKGGTAGQTLAATGPNAYFLVSGDATVLGAGTYTNSIWIRRNTGTGTVKIYYPTIPSTVLDITSLLTASYQRFQTSGSVSGTLARFGVQVVSSGDAIDVAFGQIEAGSFATSYIGPTTTAAISVTDYATSVNVATLAELPAKGATLYGVGVNTLAISALKLASSVTINGIVTDLSSGAAIAGREMLAADRTYYVRTDGNDSNTGLANTSGSALLTIQAAVNKVSTTLDMGIYQVTIQVGNGTYANVFLKPYIGSLPPVILGDATTPSNVLITASSGTLSAVALINTYCPAFCIWTLRGLKMTTTGTGYDCVLISVPSRIQIDACEFGTCINRHMDCQNGGQIWPITSYTISGGAKKHIITGTFGEFRVISGITVTLTGTPEFSEQFINALQSGIAFFAGATFSGSATGNRYVIDSNAIVYTNGGGATFLPGNSGGTLPTNGGLYL